MTPVSHHIFLLLTQSSRFTIWIPDIRNRHRKIFFLIFFSVNVTRQPLVSPVVLRVKINTWQLWMKVLARIKKHDICKIKYPYTLLGLEKKENCSVPGGSDDSSGQILNKHSVKHCLIISSDKMMSRGVIVKRNDFSKWFQVTSSKMEGELCVQFYVSLSLLSVKQKPNQTTRTLLEKILTLRTQRLLQFRGTSCTHYIYFTATN